MALLFHATDGVRTRKEKTLEAYSTTQLDLEALVYDGIWLV